jgi:hypothetical protein
VTTTTPPPAGLTLTGRVLAVLALSAVTPLTACARAPAPAPPTASAAIPAAPTASPPASTTGTLTGPGTLTGRPAGTPRGDLPGPATVDGTQPGAVARWVLTAWYGYDTALDSGPSDAARRALPWLTPHLAGVVRQAAPVAAPPVTWTRWAQARAYATVRLTPGADDHPPDTALQAFRVYAADLTLHPAQQADGTHLAAFVHLTRLTLTDTWRVEEVLTR